MATALPSTSDPAGELGTVTLDGIGDEGCNGAPQIVDLGGDGQLLAVACDGNETAEQGM